ncbi:MAG: MerR family DNA-binding transcriptional regulator [Chromatiales bacterium]|jgi:DNA-binding transcriptional MerR regulator|nr:MerR family DNA-binding transcriptional regulator [Chromatiales bacterium]
METFSIGELSREFEVTARSIRFYEDRGLLAPSRRGQNRVYSARDKVRLMLILRGKRLGFSISEIGEILDLYDAPNGEVGQLSHFVGKIRERRQALRKQAEDIETVLRELDSVERRCLDLLGRDEADTQVADSPRRSASPPDIHI